MDCPTAPPVGTSGATTESSCPTPRSRTGSRRREKKADSRLETDYLDWALADFSGYLVLDEMYDGPFCVLSAVERRNCREAGRRATRSPSARSAVPRGSSDGWRNCSSTG